MELRSLALACMGFCAEDETWPVFVKWVQEHSVTETGAEFGATAVIDDLCKSYVAFRDGEDLAELAQAQEEQAKKIRWLLWKKCSPEVQAEFAALSFGDLWDGVEA